MKLLFWLFFAFWLILIQTTLIPFNWALMLVLAAVFLKKGREIAWLSFLIGLLLDLFVGKPLGGSSLFFTVTTGAVYFVQGDLLAFGLPVVFALSFTSDLLFDFFLFRSFSFGKNLIFGLIFTFIYGCLFAFNIFYSGLKYSQ